MKIEVEGALDIQKALAELGDPRAVRVALRKALRAAAAPMLDAAKARVPVDQGDLQRSLKMAAAKGEKLDSPQFGIVIGIDANEQPATYLPRKKARKATTRKSRSGIVPIVATHYRDPGVAGVGPITEFGRPGEPARPFMRPAFDGEGDATIWRFGKVAGQVIEHAAQRLAKKRGAG